MKKLTFTLLITIITLPIPFATSFITNKEVQKEQRMDFSKSKTATAIAKIDSSLTGYEMAILLAEYDKKAWNRNNPGNLRQRNGEYYTYSSKKQGIDKFRRLIQTKYKNCTQLPDTACLRCIADRYSELPDVWYQRAKYRLDQITSFE